MLVEEGDCIRIKNLAVDIVKKKVKDENHLQSQTLLKRLFVVVVPKRWISLI
jgi:hypothetical protein